jgi:hypothetical protein
MSTGKQTRKIRTKHPRENTFRGSSLPVKKPILLPIFPADKMPGDIFVSSILISLNAGAEV